MFIRRVGISALRGGRGSGVKGAIGGSGVSQKRGLHKLTVVLDLDECLVHSQFVDVDNRRNRSYRYTNIDV